MTLSPIVWDMKAKRRGSRPEDVGQRVKAAREALRLTQMQVAGQADITQPTLSAIERGETKDPEAETILRLAIALRCTPYYLMWDHQMPANVEPTHAFMLELWNALDLNQRAQVTAYAQALVDSGRKDRPDPKPSKPQPPRPPGRHNH